MVRLGRRSEQALYDLRARLIAHIHRISLADHNEERRGALVARVTSDIETLAQFFQWGGLAWLLDGPLMLMVAAVMLAYNWMLALVAFAVAAPLAIVLRVVQRHLVAGLRAGPGAQRRDAGGDHRGRHRRRDDPRLRRRGARSGRGRRAAIERRTRAQIRANVIGAFLFPSGEMFSVLTVSAVLVVGVVLGPASGLTAGAMIGFIFLTYRFLEPIAEFTEVLDQTQTAVAGLRRVLGVLDLRSARRRRVEPRPLPPGPLAIDIRDVTFSYPTRGLAAAVDEAVLRDVTAHIPAGQQVALVGATGSGKTTLGRLIARFADPTIGEIRLGGVPLRDVANDELRRRLVVVSQEPFLFSDTIAANIGFARPGTSLDEMEAVVDRLDVGDWVDGLPDGLLTRVGQRGDQLSAGERQLVALLRAGVADPDVLVLDEATSSVDALTEVRISRALTHLAEGRTTIAIAHRLSTAARADRVLVLARRPARRGRPPRRAGGGRRHLRPPLRRLDGGDQRPPADPSALAIRVRGSGDPRSLEEVGVEAERRRAVDGDDRHAVVGVERCPTSRASNVGRGAGRRRPRRAPSRGRGRRGGRGRSRSRVRRRGCRSRPGHDLGAVRRRQVDRGRRGGRGPRSARRPGPGRR